MSDEETRLRLLGIYLNDHLAGATAGVGRARMARDANRGTEFAAPLARVCGEIEEDRATLERLIDDLGVGRSKLKPALAWVGERIGRAKPNGQLRGYSPLGRVVDLEILLLGISGKHRLWILLGELLGDGVPVDLATLKERAEGQRAVVDDLQIPAVRLL